MGYMKDFDRRIRQGGDDAVRAALEYALTVAARWIPIHERLPEHLQPVIGWYPGSRRAFGEVCWNATEQQWQDVDTGLSEPVTHWMPLPEPPPVDERASIISDRRGQRAGMLDHSKPDNGNWVD